MVAHEQDKNRIHCADTRRWLRHTAMVPKGFIRYHVLEGLSQKPMSGSELMDDIEQHTGGFWKPSPGSIYPLLSWLQDNGYIKELPVENGLKRYELTESGKALLEKQKMIRRQVREEGGFSPAFFDNFFMKIPPEKTAEIFKSMKQLSMAFYHLGTGLQESFSEEALNEALGVVDEASTKFEAIYKKLKGRKND